MRKLFYALIILLSICFLFAVSAEAKPTPKKSNYKIVKTLARKSGRPIKLVKYHNKKTDYIIVNRKNRKYLVVEKVVSISNGKDGGYTFDGCYIAYNKKTARDKLVTSYIIYSPYSNEFDEILYVVDHNTYR